MNSRFFDMLHDPRHNGCLAVTDRIHVHFHRVFQKFIDQNRVTGRNKKRLGHKRLQRFLIIDDFHRTSAQHVGGAHKHRIADALCGSQRLLDIHGRIIIRLIEI